MGKKWQDHVNGKELHEQLQDFKNRLKEKPLFDQWLVKIKSQPEFEQTQPIFKVEVGVNKSMSVNVNFDDYHVLLFKEVGCLNALAQDKDDGGQERDSGVGRLQEIVNELGTGGYSNVQIMCSSKKLIVFLF